MGTRHTGIGNIFPQYSKSILVQDIKESNASRELCRCFPPKDMPTACRASECSHMPGGSTRYKALNTFHFACKLLSFTFKTSINMITLKLAILVVLPTLALGAEPVWGSMPFPDPMNSLCVVWTVVEHSTHISTCFPSSTVATLQGCTTTISGPTCIDTTFTSSQTIKAPTSIATAAAKVLYNTFTTDTLTTVCPSPTTFTQGS